MITALILLPLAGALCVSVARPNHARAIALVFNALTAILALAKKSGTPLSAIMPIA